MKHFKLKRFLLVAVFATFLCNVCWADDETTGSFTQDEITYTYTVVDNEITITDVTVPAGVESVTFPSTIDGKKVVAIIPVKREGAAGVYPNIFNSTFNTSGINVTIPENISTLGANCFYNCWGLKSISLPSTLETLGENCFYQCDRLTSITLPSSVTTLGDACFSNCTALTTFVFSDGENSNIAIPKQCFYMCSELTSLVLPKITSIGYESFKGNESLSYVIIPMDNLQEISKCPFQSGNTNLEIILTGKPNNELESSSYTSLLRKNIAKSSKFYKVYYPVLYQSDYIANIAHVKNEKNTAIGDVYAYRITSARYSTVSLPYTLKPASDCLGIAKFYEEKEDGGLNADKTEITFSEPTSMTQGKPYVFEQASANADGEDFAPQSQFGITGFVAFALSDPTETAATEVQSGTYLKGTFSDMKYDDLNGNESCYLLQSGVFKKWADSGAWLDAYRAYLDLSAASSSSNSKAGRVTIHFDDSEATGIAEIKSETVKDDRISDLQGRRITRPVSGQLYIKNGQKYIAR